MTVACLYPQIKEGSRIEVLCFVHAASLCSGKFHSQMQCANIHVFLEFVSCQQRQIQRRNVAWLSGAWPNLVRACIVAQGCFLLPIVFSFAFGTPDFFLFVHARILTVAFFYPQMKEGSKIEVLRFVLAA